MRQCSDCCRSSSNSTISVVVVEKVAVVETGRGRSTERLCERRRRPTFTDTERPRDQQSIGRWRKPTERRGYRCTAVASTRYECRPVQFEIDLEIWHTRSLNPCQPVTVFFVFYQISMFFLVFLKGYLFLGDPFFSANKNPQNSIFHRLGRDL